MASLELTVVARSPQLLLDRAQALGLDRADLLAESGFSELPIPATDAILGRYLEEFAELRLRSLPPAGSSDPLGEVDEPAEFRVCNASAGRLAELAVEDLVEAGRVDEALAPVEELLRVGTADALLDGRTQRTETTGQLPQ